MKTIKYEMTYEEQLCIPDISSPVPSNIQIRIHLNKQGFKFEDDGKVGLIINNNPKPLGTFTVYKDAATESIHFKQALPDTGLKA